jgi:hypothetical protein
LEDPQLKGTKAGNGAGLHSVGISANLRDIPAQPKPLPGTCAAQPMTEDSRVSGIFDYFKCNLDNGLG